jgi:hypothetical protein
VRVDARAVGGAKPPVVESDVWPPGSDNGEVRNQDTADRDEQDRPK